MNKDELMVVAIQACISAQNVINGAAKKRDEDDIKERGKFLYEHANYILRSSLYNLWVAVSKDLSAEGLDEYQKFFWDNFSDSKLDLFQQFNHGMEKFAQDYKFLFEDKDKDDQSN